MSKPSKRPHCDPRFALHQQQPRANKLGAQQRRICNVDPAFLRALEVRVNDPRRFAAFLAGMPSYVRLSAPCERCGGFRRRTRDRACYTCHLNRGRENFERMKAGLSPQVKHSRDGYLDVLDRRRREKDDGFVIKEFGRISVKHFPTGRLEVTYPDGYVEQDLSTVSGERVWKLMEMLPEMKDALIWAGWY